MLRLALRKCSTVMPRRLASSQAKQFDPKHLEMLVCPLSKKPLKYDAQRNLLINEDLNVGYKVIDGIPCLIPEEGKILS